MTTEKSFPMTSPPGNLLPKASIPHEASDPDAPLPVISSPQASIPHETTNPDAFTKPEGGSRASDKAELADCDASSQETHFQKHQIHMKSQIPMLCRSLRVVAGHRRKLNLLIEMLPGESFCHIEGKHRPAKRPPAAANLAGESAVIRYFQHIQQPHKSILSVQAGVREPPLFVSPFGEPPVVILLFCILDDKGDHVMV